jgi:lysophospholipid acyltransferase (LPLAT)-like uncharacterized protein
MCLAFKISRKITFLYVYIWLVAFTIPQEDVYSQFRRKDSGVWIDLKRDGCDLSMLRDTPIGRSEEIRFMAK